MNRETSFDPMADRYKFDTGMCSVKNGYAQVDTNQDASYYGTWTNPHKLVMVTFAEGDIDVTTFDDVDEYCKFIRKFAEWHNKHSIRGFLGIDPMLSQSLTDRFKEIGLTDLLHESCRGD